MSPAIIIIRRIRIRIRIRIIIIIITFFNVITFRSFIVIWLLAIFLLAKTKCAKFLTLDLRVM